jgi:hypothetical protein
MRSFQTLKETSQVDLGTFSHYLAESSSLVSLGRGLQRFLPLILMVLVSLTFQEGFCTGFHLLEDLRLPSP